MATYEKIASEITRETHDVGGERPTELATAADYFKPTSKLLSETIEKDKRRKSTRPAVTKRALFSAAARTTLTLVHWNLLMQGRGGVGPRASDPGEALNNADVDLSQFGAKTEGKTSCNVKHLRTEDGIQAREFSSKEKGDAARTQPKAPDPSDEDDMFHDYLELWVQVRSFNPRIPPGHRRPPCILFSSCLITQHCMSALDHVFLSF